MCMNSTSMKRLTPQRALKALRNQCGGMTQAQFATLIGLKNHRSLTNIETGRYPLTWKLACRIQEETGVLAASLMENNETPRARFRDEPFTRKHFNQARNFYFPTAGRSAEEAMVWETAVAADIDAAKEVLGLLLRVAKDRRKIMAAQSAFDFWVAEAVEEFGLKTEVEKLARLGDSYALHVMRTAQHVWRGKVAAKPKAKARAQ
jgi:DNA-binding XRE family transcriptional regulator